MSVVTEVLVDDVLSVVGGFGPFQWICTAIFCIMVLPATYQVLIMYFLALRPSWRCKPNSFHCTENGTQILVKGGVDKVPCIYPRDEWEFVETKGYSIITEFDITCEREWLLQFATGIFFLGAAIGGLFFGFLADRKGRKFVLFTSMGFLIVTGLASIFSPHIYVFIASRLLAGSFYAGTLAMMIILSVELVQSNRRALASNTVWLFYALAFCVLSLKAYFIRKWKILLVISTAPYFFLIIFYKFIPESVRWLSLQGKLHEIEELFAKIAKINKRTFTADAMKTETRDVKVTSSSFMGLFRPIKVGLKTIVQAYSWMVCSIMYYGLSLAADELGGSMYLNFALVALMECPGNIAGAYFATRFGRKKTCSIPMFIASIACIIIPFIPKNGTNKIGRVACGMVGKFFITICYSCLYLWSAEIFPTKNRAKGIGFLQIFEMIGGTCAPFIANELLIISGYAPFLCFGISAIIGSVLMICLPETKGKSMDDSDE